MRRGEIFILAASSGAAAATLLDRVLSRAPEGSGGLVRPVRHASRPPREGESDGADYHFVAPERFRRMIDEDRFLEWSEVHGLLFGTAREEVDARLEGAIDVVLESDLDGAERLLAACPAARSVVVLPPGAGDSDVSASEKRLYDRFDCVIIHDDLRRAGEQLASITLENRHPESRVEERA